MAIKKIKKVEKCSYCGKESDKHIKVGPTLRYCDYPNCYAKACYASGGILAEMIAIMYPEVVVISE